MSKRALVPYLLVGGVLVVGGALIWRDRLASLRLHRAVGRPASARPSSHALVEEALGRLQGAIDEIRVRLPELQDAPQRHKQMHQRLNMLGDQAQALLKDMRARSLFRR